MCARKNKERRWRGLEEGVILYIGELGKLL
jgi:hypothetical protein